MTATVGSPATARVGDPKAGIRVHASAAKAMATVTMCRLLIKMRYDPRCRHNTPSVTVNASS